MTRTPDDHLQHHRHPVRRVVLSIIKWVIAIVGLWYVISHIHWSDRVTIAAGVNIRNVIITKATPMSVVAVHHHVYVLDFRRKPITVRLPDGKTIRAWATHAPIDFPPTLGLPADYLVQSHGKPVVQLGFLSLLTHSKPLPLLLAFALLGIPFLITAWRWQRLLHVCQLNLTYRRCLTLTFLGQFYSTFLPGTTSGDIVKIVYTGRITGQKTKSAITVILDRVIGLVGLIIVGFTAALVELLLTAHTGAKGADPVLLHVVMLTGAMLVLTGIGSIIYFSRRMRRALGLDYLIEKLPLPEFLKHADRTLAAYRGHLGVIAVALIASVISQAVLPIAGFLAGQAFGMHDPLGYYLAYIPLAVLAASIPILPPQGIGVMDWIILHFFVTRSTNTASQAFALTQAIRFLPIIWNLVGAWWVVRGNYSRPHVEDLDELTQGEPAVSPGA
jgi:uncharacterized protein (TIRG00374 family)